MNLDSIDKNHCLPVLCFHQLSEVGHSETAVALEEVASLRLGPQMRNSALLLAMVTTVLSDTAIRLADASPLAQTQPLYLYDQRDPFSGTELALCELMPASTQFENNDWFNCNNSPACYVNDDPEVTQGAARSAFDQACDQAGGTYRIL